MKTRRHQLMKIWFSQICKLNFELLSFTKNKEIFAYDMHHVTKKIALIISCHFIREKEKNCFKLFAFCFWQTNSEIYFLLLLFWQDLRKKRKFHYTRKAFQRLQRKWNILPFFRVVLLRLWRPKWLFNMIFNKTFSRAKICHKFV